MSQLVADFKPSLLLHCGAVCDVPKCQADPEWAYRINVESIPELLGALPDECRLVYVSSDHVFSGDSGPYDEASPLDPITIYGETRVAAERIMLEQPDSLVIRFSLAVGKSADGRSGHLDWLRYRSSQDLPISVVTDEFRAVVEVSDLAERVIALAMSDIVGIRHAWSVRTISRKLLADTLCREFKIDTPITFETRADRRYPHLGRVKLQTIYDDALSAPLPSVLEPSVLERIAMI